MSAVAAPASLLEYGPSLSLAQAKLVLAAAEAAAEAHHWPVIIAIVDNAGHLMLFEKLEQAQLGSIPVAIAKAETAVKFRRATKLIEDALAGSTLGLRFLTIPGVAAIDGGLPLMAEGKVVGAIGVAGMLPTQDAEVASAGARALAPTG